MSDIVGIGCAVFDFMLILDHWPEEDTKTSSGQSKIQCGGPCAVAMIAASKLGVSSAFLGKVGDDIYGSTIRERLDHYGADVSGLTVVPGKSAPCCVVLSNRANSSRTCIGGGTGNDPETVLMPEDVDLDLIRNAKYLHVDGMNPKAAIYAAKEARKCGVKVCMDADGIVDGMEELMVLSNVLIPSEHCACKLAGTSDPQEAAKFLYEKYKPEVLIVTCGPKGGVMIYEDKLTTYPAFEVEAIDSNGSGDVFHGAWIAASIKGMDPYEATRFASAASAIKCTHFGAAEGAPHFEDVIAFLKEHEKDELHLFTGRAEKSYSDVSYGTEAYLVFGRESAGLDEGFMDAYEDRCVRIPMREGLRSLNLSNAVAIGVYEALRQQGFEGLL